MVHIAVFGNSKWSSLLKDLLEKEYSDLCMENGKEPIAVDVFVVLGTPASDGEITVEEFGKRYTEGELSAIVIPKENCMQHNHLLFSLLRLGINVGDIYDGIRLSEQTRNQPDAIANLIIPMLSDSYLPYLEFHVADHCNLNCKYCTHYSPLVTEPVFTDYDSFAEDLSGLKRFIRDIGVVRILGGEPLLNPELPAYIRLVRRLYPSAIITVVTNGLLLRKIDQELMECMKKEMAFFHISFYPPLKDQIGEIEKFLYKNGILFTVSPMISEFCKTQTLTPREDGEFFYQCFQATCNCLHHHKVAACYAPFTTGYFNTAFSQDLPEEEGIDLYEESLTLYDLKLRLLLPMERCRYCVNGGTSPWMSIGRHSNLEDWIS